jgi:hypothetical protein
MGILGETKEVIGEPITILWSRHRFATFICLVHPGQILRKLRLDGQHGALAF